MQKEPACNASLAEKKTKIAKASSSRGTSLRSMSPVELPGDSSTKVLARMKKAKATKILAKSIIAPSVHEKKRVSKPVNAGQSTNERHFNANTRDRRPAVKPTTPTTAAALQDDGKESKKKNGACIQSSTTQTEAIFATTKPLRIKTVGQREILIIKTGKPSGAFDVPQFGRMPRKQVPNHLDDIASNTRRLMQQI